MLELSSESFASLMRGILVGIVLAIPVGPIAVLCMRRTLERGPVFGFATGIGAAAADMFYGAVAAFGIAAISGFLSQHFMLVRLIGGTFMICLAIRLALRRKAIKPAPSTTGRTLGALLSGFVLTVTNPMTMVGFAAVFTGFGFGDAIGNADLATFLVIGVGIGSALWWLTLTLGVVRLRNLISEHIVHRINLFAAGILGLFGVYAIGSGLATVMRG